MNNEVTKVNKVTPAIPKNRQRIHPGVYGIATGVLIALIGVIWVIVSNILVAIDGFGLGSIVNVLPIIGMLVVVLGIAWTVLNFIYVANKSEPSKAPTAENEVVNKKTPVDEAIIAQIHSQESSRFDKKHIKGVLFDLDGTLLDTIDDLTDAGNNVLMRHSLPTQTRDYFRQSVGNGLRNLMKKVAPEGLTESEIDQLYHEMLQEYAINYMDKTQPYDGIYEVMQDLVSKGYLLAVLTNKKQDYVQSLIKKHFPDIPFVCLLGANENMPIKPDPALVNLIADEMLLQPNELVMIGDSEVDVLTANNAGCLSVAVDWGFRSASDLKKTNTDYVISLPSELTMILDELNRRDAFVIYSQEKLSEIEGE